MSNLRPCSYCGQGQFLCLQDVAIELKKREKKYGVEMYTQQHAYVHVNAMVCTHCCRVEWFATNGEALQSVPGATLVHAVTDAGAAR